MCGHAAQGFGHRAARLRIAWLRFISDADIRHIDPEIVTCRFVRPYRSFGSCSNM